MEKKDYDLCIEVLRRFQKANILNGLVLIGSWCIYFYKHYFSSLNYTPTIRTRDIDILVPLPSKIKNKVDVPALLKDLGFVIDFKGSKGYIKLDHPDLIVEFLVPEKGRGLNEPYPLRNLGVNAQALRFLSFLADNIIKVNIDNITIRIPHPAAFALHKLIILQRRTKTEKSEKDKEQALMILDYLIQNKDELELKRTFRHMPQKWQKKVLDSLKPLEQEKIIKILTGK